MKGKLCVITGATSGIGKAAATALGNLNAALVLIGRNERMGRSLVARLQRKTGSSQVEFLRVDLSSQSEVRVLAQEILKRHPVIDVLINNAGARFDEYHPSADGHELTFATNHLGHFLLTGLLQEALLQAPRGRVITVSSGSHGAARLNGSWEYEAANYDRKQAYAKSKLANVLFAYELSRRLEGTRVASNAVNPGGVASRFARNNGWLSWARHLFSHALRGELISPQQGADTIVYLATAPDLDGVTGKYFYCRQQTPSAPASYDQRAARELWVLSARLTGLNNQN